MTDYRHDRTIRKTDIHVQYIIYMHKVQYTGRWGESSAVRSFVQLDIGLNFILIS